MPRIELINSGTELLEGDILNTHLGYLSTQLRPLGLHLDRQHTVPDGAILKEALEECTMRADLILVTGGLGPTSDDLTRDLLAELMGAELKEEPAIIEAINQFFSGRKIQPPQTVMVQALVPVGAEFLPNAHGTAPGLYAVINDCHVFCLPGPPRELYPMVENQILPLIQKLFPHPPIYKEVLRVMGHGESSVQEIVEPLLEDLDLEELGYCARPGEVDLRLMSTNASDIAEAVSRVSGQKKLKTAIYSQAGETMEQVVVKLAIEKNLKLATAESCTGGRVASRITDVPGSSAIFDRGWVTYSNEAKEVALGVSYESLAEYGAVSAPVACEMAEAALKNSKADLSVSLTGIAGPSGGSPEKPVGLVYLGEAWREGSKICSIAHEKRLVPQRETFKTMASQQALNLFRQRLLETDRK